MRHATQIIPRWYLIEDDLGHYNPPGAAFELFTETHTLEAL